MPSVQHVRNACSASTFAIFSALAQRRAFDVSLKNRHSDYFVISRSAKLSCRCFRLAFSVTVTVVG
jgi:hypothetical protein